MHETRLDSETETLTIEPKLYKVYLINDNWTSMEFVVKILMNIFHHSNQDANEIMMNVHNNGKGLCGEYTYDIAITKVTQVAKEAKENGYPLKAEIQENI